MNETIKKQNVSKKRSLRSIFILAVVFLLIITVLVYFICTQEPKSDPASEKIIREITASQFNKDPNELTDEDFAKITEFSLMKQISAGSGLNGEKLFTYKKIELPDIKLLEKFVNLQKLNLIYIYYLDESTVVDTLSKLGLTNPSQKKFLDLSPLKNLNNLQSLDLTQTQVSDIQAISGLINLQELIIDNTQVSDLKPVERLINLQILSICNTKISDLEPIRNLTNLQRLWLFDTEVSDIEPIKNLTNLQWLHLQNTPISDLEPLKKLINLKQLWLRNCKKITDEQVEDLQKVLPNLKIYR